LIIIKKYLFTIALISIYSCSSNKIEANKINIKDENEIRIGFGSCLKQNKPMPIFESIRAENLDLFLMIGDNVYGDSRTEDLKELQSAYNLQQQNFKNMKLNFPFEAIWDDHDYGLNDAGKEYLFKESSKELFLDFWNIPLNDPRRSRAGLYHDIFMNFKEKKIQIIFLDTRTFRDNLKPTDDKGAAGKERYIPYKDSSLTMLGFEQWEWLRNKMSEHTDYRIIVSSIQLLPVGHGWECWYNLPYERDRIINLIDDSSFRHTLILSGDRHRGGLYQFKTKKGNIISEMTSSSLNASFPNLEESGPLRIGNTFVEENYGTIYINGLRNILTVMLKNINGKTLQSLEIKN
tara:strand:+ start:138 stop:1181 length:1044 start_codon:yes stop_codon:yes gene_type:complete